MSASFADYLRRSLVPSAVIAASRLRGPRVALARAARRFGRPITLEAYFAFDDPYAAIALPALFDRVAARPVAVRLYPLMMRGIADDPAQLARTRHALADAKRLALRNQQDLRRSQPLAAQDCAFLAAWTAAIPDARAAMAFASDALKLLWRDSDGEVSALMFDALYRTRAPQAPPVVDASLLARLQRNADRLYAKGHWESPAVRIAGEWFLAHERLAQISHRLDELGA